jgi:fibronectin type 3 domain-containing protein
MKQRLKNKLKKKLLQKVDRQWIGYHVYRSTNPALPFALWERLTDDPIPDGQFDDPAAGVGTRYYYKLTRVDTDGRESSPVSPQVGYTDHAGNRFDQNPLIDFVGYNIYRSADKNLPPERWERRNSEPLRSAEFKDEGVASGEVFYYYVRAVDSEGNESAPGEIIRVVRA